MKTRIQVMSAETREGVGKKSGQHYKMTVCQCVIHGEKIQVGELILPKDHSEVQPGMYDAEFEIGVDLQTKRIGGVLKRLVPVTTAASRVAA